MDHGSVTIDFCAVRKNDSVRIAGLNNPNQTNAYDYGQDVLIGSPLKENEPKKAPLFERAEYIGTPDKGLVFISGTASITNEKTIGLNDIVTQTIVTLNNISDLTSDENLKSIDVTAYEKNYTYFRVYVKDMKQLNTVRRIYETQYKKIPALYVKADICRENLLVEIEGEKTIMELGIRN
jgi:enamine deaminase RidA (YjgF/YER057c/UK114 family)